MFTKQRHLLFFLLLLGSSIGDWDLSVLATLKVPRTLKLHFPVDDPKQILVQRAGTFEPLQDTSEKTNRWRYIHWCILVRICLSLRRYSAQIFGLLERVFEKVNSNGSGQEKWERVREEARDCIWGQDRRIRGLAAAYIRDRWVTRTAFAFSLPLYLCHSPTHPPDKSPLLVH